jgi:hypothetical protein
LKNYKVHVSFVTLLFAFGLASCNAGQANVSDQQQPIFASAPGSPVPVACGASNVVIGDLNKDSKPDLIVTCGQGRAVTVLLGTRDGNFRASNPVSVPDGPGEVVLGDLNGDSNLDVAIDSHDSYNVVVLLGDGKGGLALAANSPIVMKEGTHPHTHGLAIADINGDHKLDLITVNNSDNDVSIAFGDGRGGFTRAPATFPVGPSPYPLAVGDVNNDGHLDIINTATATGPMRRQQLPLSFALTLLLNDGRGGFRSSQLPLRTGEPWSVAVGDVNDDRKQDLVVTHHNQSVLTVLLGDGVGRFTEVDNSPFDFGRTAFEVILADVNRDGQLDALAAAGEGVRVMLGDGHGNFKPAPGSPFLTGKGVWRLAVADINADGKLDVVTSNMESNSVGILLGQ